MVRYALDHYSLFPAGEKIKVVAKAKSSMNHDSVIFSCTEGPCQVTPSLWAELSKIEQTVWARVFPL